MEIIRYILIVIEVLCCLLLIGVILLQQSKSQGMGLAFGGGMGETLFGSRAGNVLTKITVTLALVFLANTTLLGILYTTGEEKSLVESASAPAPLPVAPSQPQSGMITAPPAGSTPPMLTVDESPMPMVEASAQDSEPMSLDDGTSPVVNEAVLVETVEGTVDERTEIELPTDDAKAAPEADANVEQP